MYVKELVITNLKVNIPIIPHIKTSQIDTNGIQQNETYITWGKGFLIESQMKYKGSYLIEKANLKAVFT